MQDKHKPLSVGKYGTIPLFICLIFILTACKYGDAPHEVPVQVKNDTLLSKCEFYEVGKEIIRSKIRLFGKITADNNKMVRIYPVVSGIVSAIHAELGDYVKQGQKLATIRSSEVAGFRKERAVAVNNLAVAEKNLQVSKELFSAKLNSEKDVSAALEELEKARAELVRIKEVYAIYHIREGSEFDVTAPISGFIVDRQLSLNEEIRPDNTSSVFSIAEINEVWLIANVNESMISKIRLGQEATIRTLAFPDTVYKGKIDKILNMIDPTTKTMKAIVKIPNADFRLKPEMNCTVELSSYENQKMISVPAASVVFDRSKYWVIVFNGEHSIEIRNVEPYSQTEKEFYIKNGLKAGETIISKNVLRIYDTYSN